MIDWPAKELEPRRAELRLESEPQRCPLRGRPCGGKHDQRNDDDLPPEYLCPSHGAVPFWRYLPLQAQTAVAPEVPVDTTIAARDSRDVFAQMSFDGRCLGHELKPKSVVDHGEATGGEGEATLIGSGYKFTS